MVRPCSCAASDQAGRPDYSWLHVAVLDRKGRIRHDGGVVATPGMYVALRLGGGATRCLHLTVKTIVGRPLVDRVQNRFILRSDKAHWFRSEPENSTLLPCRACPGRPDGHLQTPKTPPTSRPTCGFARATMGISCGQYFPASISA